MSFFRNTLSKLKSLYKYFLKHQSTLLTFLGAAIVLATFVVKDAIRENVKDLLQSIDAAQSIFVLRNDTATVIDLLRAVEKNMALRQETTVAGKGQLTTERLSYDLLDNVVVLNGRLESTIEASLGNISELIAKLPEDRLQTRHEKNGEVFWTDDRDKLSELNKELLSIVQSSIDIAAEWNEKLPLQGNQKEWTTRLVQLSEKVSELERRAGNLMTDTNQFQVEIVRKAQNVAREKERDYGRYTLWSYALFVIGWLLGLVGKLKGVEVQVG